MGTSQRRILAGFETLARMIAPTTASTTVNGMSAASVHETEPAERPRRFTVTVGPRSNCQTNAALGVTVYRLKRADVVESR